MVLRLLYATKTKKLHGKLDRLGKDCISGRNKDLVVSCTTLTEMQLKPRKARCCQSERFTSAYVWDTYLGTPTAAGEVGFSNLSKLICKACRPHNTLNLWHSP